MTIKNIIVNPGNKIAAEVVDGVEKNALVVATRPLKAFENKVLFFFNDTYGVNMNIDGSAGGTPIKVHDGIDSVLWTGSVIVGTNWTFNDAAQNHTAAGATSISGILLTQGDVAQFNKGSSQDLTGYSSITLWIYVSANWSIDIVSFYGWDTGTGLIVGNKIDLSNYINVGDIGTWQKVAIPLGDLGLVKEIIDAFRISYDLRIGSKVSLYIDDIQIEETGAPIEFKVKPSKGTWLHVQNMLVSIVDEYDGTLTDATMPKLPYDSILGVSELSTGIRWAKWINGEIISSFVIHKLMDAMELPSASIRNYGDDGTDVWLTLNFEFTEPLILKARDEDHLLVTVNDNLLGLKHLRMSVGCKEEIREDE